MIEYKDMHWEGDNLFYGSKDTTVKLVMDDKFLGMYRLEWNFDKPERSVNFYNITNAKDNARVLYMRYRNNTAENSPPVAPLVRLNRKDVCR